MGTFPLQISCFRLIPEHQQWTHVDALMYPWRTLGTALTMPAAAA